MKFPVEHALDCQPLGMLRVIFDREEDHPEYNLLGVPESLAVSAHDEVVAHWSAVWDDARGYLEELLADKCKKTPEELLSDPRNSLNVLILASEGKERYRLDVFIDIKYPMDSPVFSVVFEELVATDAYATY